MSESRTSVVVITRNRVQELVRTLHKLLALRPQPPIIVVDNGSTDETVPRTRDLSRDVDLTLIPRSQNSGAAGRNIGVEAAGTPFVAFADDDSWWAPNALDYTEAIFDQHPDVGLIAARTLVGPEERLDPVCELMANSPLGTAPGLPGPSVLGFLACSAIVRKDAFVDAGGFSRLLHFAGEEKLLSYDLAARHWELCYVDEVVAHHHPSRRRPSYAHRRGRELRNDALIAWMRRPGAHGVGSTFALLRRAVREPRQAYVATGALRRLPAALRQRRPLPSEVEDKIERLARN